MQSQINIIQTPQYMYVYPLHAMTGSYVIAWFAVVFGISSTNTTTDSTIHVLCVASTVNDGWMQIRGDICIP